MRVCVFMALQLEADFGVKSTEISDLENQLAASRKVFENEVS